MGLAVKLLSKEINSSLCLLKSQIRLKLVCTEMPNAETWKRRSPSDSCHPAQDNHAIRSTLSWWRGQGCEPGLQSRGGLLEKPDAHADCTAGLGEPQKYGGRRLASESFI